MTVKVDDRRKEHPGNGVATVFNGPMAYSASHIQAWLVDEATGVATLVPGSAYDVDRIGRQNGTRVVMDTAPPTGQTLLLLRVVPIAQTVDITNQGDFNASVLETMGDLLAMQIQQLLDGQNHKIGIPETSLDDINVTLPPPAPTVLWGWDDTGKVARYYTLLELANFIAYGDKTVLVRAGTGVQTIYPLGRDPGSIGNLDVSIDGVTQVNGLDFTYSGTDLIFTVAPPDLSTILIRFDQAVPVGTGLSSSIFYTPPSTLVPGSVQSFLDSLWTAASNAGAALIRFIQAGVGAVARTVQAKLRERYSLHDFLTDSEIADSLTGAPVIDITAKAQAALVANKGKLYIPGGSYLCGAITMSTAVVIQGEGTAVDTGFRGTRIVTPGAGSDWLVVDSHNPSTIRDIAIQCALPTAAGSGITLKCTTPFLGTVNRFSLLDNVRFENVFVGLNAERASSWVCRDCVFWDIPANGFGCLVNNTFNEDQGDQRITGCTFAGDASAVGVAWSGGGGTRIVDNKFFMPKAIYADLTQTVGGETAQFLVANNSFDIPVNPGGALVHPVSFQMVGGVTAFENIIISDNLFIGYFAMSEMLALRGLSGAKIENVTITGNIMTNPTGSFTGSGMLLLEHVNDFTISGNTIIGPGASNGINIDASCGQGNVNGNHVRGFTNNYLNASTSTAIRKRSDSGVTGSVSDGGVVTHNLGVAPTKIIISGSTAAQTYVPFAPTSTQFQVAVRNTAGASGTAATIYWIVEE